MSDHQYQRVTRTTLLNYGTTYLPDAGPMKVVPADAIVIERGELPEARVDGNGDRVQAGASSWPLRIARPSASDIRADALGLLSIAEYLAAHPPVNEARVREMVRDMLDEDEPDMSRQTSADAEEYARRLVELGWSKPEPTP